MAEAPGVLVLGEPAQGSLSSTTKEMLAAGRRLADGLGQPLSLALLGAALEDQAKEAIAWGADRVCTVSHSLLAEYQAELHLAALHQLCGQVKPSIILLARTAIGRDLGPRLAFRLGVGLAQDCLEVRLDPVSKRMVAIRPVYGGNAIATVACTAIPQMATVRPKVYEPLTPDPSRRGEVVAVDVELNASIVKTVVAGRVTEEAKGLKLEDSRIVVAGGRGLGGPEPFKALQELAKALGAAIGASRAAVDSGWVPPSWQIGLTGKTIAPELYITVAISGASQHMAGCSGAKVIVAINKDASANIFKEARYGVVGDWKKVLPAFTEAVRELLG